MVHLKDDELLNKPIINYAQMKMIYTREHVPATVSTLRAYLSRLWTILQITKMSKSGMLICQTKAQDL